MSPAAIVAIISVSLTAVIFGATALVRLGRVLQRIDAVEKREEDHADCAACRPEVLQRLKSSEARIRELEVDRKEHGESLSELRGEMKALREAIEGLKGVMREALKKQAIQG